jgi:tetratricopeptide (TPR) repeat protein
VASDKEERATQAMALHDEAWALYEDGHYRAAIERLEAALHIDPEGRELVYNLALLHEKLGDLHTAAEYYRRYLDMEPDPKARERVLATLRRIEGAEREGVGRPLAPLAPPPAPPLGPSRERRAWTIASGGLAGAAFLTGIGCGMTALLRNPGPNATTGDGTTIQSLQADAHAAHTAAVVADVAFVVAAAAATTALVLHYTRPRVAPLAPLAPTAGGFLKVRF